MTTQFEQQRNAHDSQNTGMYPTNGQARGPGAMGSGPVHGQNDNINQRGHEQNNNFNENGTNAQGDGYETRQQQQQQMGPPPVHPDRANQNAQYDQNEGMNGGGGAHGQSGHRANDQGLNQGVGTNGGQHRAGGAVRAAETEAEYEGGKHSHGGFGSGMHAGQYDQGTGVGTGQGDQYTSANANQGMTHGDNHPGLPTRAAEAGMVHEGGKAMHGAGAHGQHDQYTNANANANADTNQGMSRGEHHPGLPTRAAEAGMAHEGSKAMHGAGGHGQHDQYTDTNANTNQGMTHGDNHTGLPTRAAEAGMAYEGGKAVHGAGGHGQHGSRFNERFDGVGNTGNAGGVGPGYGAAPGTGPATGVGGGVGNQTGQPGTGAGVGAGTGAGMGGTAPGQSGPTQPGVGAGYNANTAAMPTHTGAGPGAPAGSGMGTSGGGSGQASVILGKLQQAGGVLLSNDGMKAKGLEREARGVAKTDEREAERLEGMAGARREKAGVVNAGAGSGVNPTVGVTFGGGMCISTQLQEVKCVREQEQDAELKDSKRNTSEEEKIDFGYLVHDSGDIKLEASYDVQISEIVDGPASRLGLAEFSTGEKIGATGLVEDGGSDSTACETSESGWNMLLRWVISATAVTNGVLV